MVAIRSPRPIRAVQRARLWAIVWTASQAAVGGEAARGEMVQPDAVLEVAYGILDLGVAAMVGLQFEQLPVPVGDEAMIACIWRRGRVGNRAPASPGRTMSRTGAASASAWKGVQVVSATSAAPSIQ